MFEILPSCPARYPALKSAEFRLLVACSYYLPNDWLNQRKQVEGALADMPDADTFKALVNHHLLPVLAHIVLARVAKETGRDLSTFMKAHASIQRTQLRNLMMHGELQRLQRLFENENITLLPLKGSTLSMKLYDDPAVRQVRDIDVMVVPADLPRSLSLMEHAGYQVEALPLRQKNPFELVNAVWWHVQCRHKKTKLLVELHWRFEHVNSAVLENCWQQWTTTIDAAQRDRYELLYLCLHGAAHDWESLKWLGDLRVLVGRMSEEDWPPLFALAQTLRMENFLAQMLLLMDWLYAFPLSNSARAFVIARGKKAVFFAETALVKILEANESVGAKLVRICKKLKSANSRYRRREQVMYWFSIHALRDDILAFPLPVFLLWVYSFMRPFSTLVRRVFRSNA
ncbi:MAG: nucleotidyltransferase family protein [Pseudomonadota bacterium]